MSGDHSPGRRFPDDAAGPTARGSVSAGSAGGLLALLQLCDSALPTGAFAHTFGMETALHRGTVHNEATFHAWLRRFLDDQLIHGDGLIVRLAAELVASTEHDPAPRLLELDELVFAQALPAQVRDAGVTMGKRLVEIASQTVPCRALLSYRNALDQGLVQGHPAIAFGLVGAELGFPVDMLVQTHVFSILTSLTQNAVRGVPIGQNAGQRVLAAMRPLVIEAAARVAKLQTSDLGAVGPGLEIAQMQHETQRARMFMS